MDPALYDQHAELEGDHWWFVGRRAVVAAVLAHHLDDGAASRRILDVGCGTGGMLPMLAAFGEVEGMEGEPLAVERCRASHPDIPVRLGEVPDDVPREGGFDLVCAFDVIEHIEDDRAALGALRDATRPGGTVAVTVPALQWLWSEHDELNGHHRRYSRSTLVAAVDDAGLELVHLSYFNSALLPAVAAARLAQRVRRRRPEPRSDFAMPAPVVNRALTRVFSAERRVVPTRRLPLGVSLVALASRL